MVGVWRWRDASEACVVCREPATSPERCMHRGLSLLSDSRRSGRWIGWRREGGGLVLQPSQGGASGTRRVKPLGAERRPVGLAGRAAIVFTAGQRPHFCVVASVARLFAGRRSLHESPPADGGGGGWPSGAAKREPTPCGGRRSRSCEGRQRPGTFRDRQTTLIASGPSAEPESSLPIRGELSGRTSRSARDANVHGEGRCRARRSTSRRNSGNSQAAWSAAR